MKIACREITSILEAACEHFDTEEVQWAAWPQTWGSTACGFGGIAGQAITEAQTMIVFLTRDTRVAVFHAGRHAYNVERPSERFWQLVKVWALPGKAQPRSDLEGAETNPGP